MQIQNWSMQRQEHARYSQGPQEGQYGSNGISINTVKGKEGLVKDKQEIKLYVVFYAVLIRPLLSV